MNSDGQKRNLGRGLSALLGENPAEPVHAGRAAPAHHVPVEQICIPAPSSRGNASTHEELAGAGANRSAQNGILQPILVRPRAGPSRQLTRSSPASGAGARRRLAKLHEVPVVLRELGDREALELAIVENLQREDLIAAGGGRRLSPADRRIRPHPGRARPAVGKSRSHVANTLRLLDLPDARAGSAGRGKLSAGHARALLGTARSGRRWPHWWSIAG